MDKKTRKNEKKENVIFPHPLSRLENPFPFPRGLLLELSLSTLMYTLRFQAALTSGQWVAEKKKVKSPLV